MPRTARSIASRGGRLSAADKISAKVPPRQTRSSTAGSSTQNQSIGSSTQNESIEKSTIDTARQTKADYAIPIQTLLAFQEQGLVSLPKQTWASIVDEDEEQESLDQIIQDLKNRSIQVNPRPTEQIVPRQEETNITHLQNQSNQNVNPQHPIPKIMPILQKQAYVKWWPRFDATKATRESIILWFKTNPKYLQVADPQSCILLNQKAQIAAALAASSSEDDMEDQCCNIAHHIGPSRARISGHYKNDCPKNKQKKPFFKKKSMMATWDDLEEAQAEDEEQEGNICLMTHSNAEEECLRAVKRRPWYLDSGCSRHMIGDRNNFLSFETREGGSVTFGNNEKASIKDLGKFDSKSDKGIFLGYSLTSKTYRIYNLRTQALEESMHVKFDEFEDQPIVHTTDDEEDEPISAQNHDSDENPTSQGPPKTWRIVGYHPPDQIIGNTEDGVRTKKALQDVETNLGLISQIEPRSINEAIIDESWIEAMKEELHQFEKNEVWNLVPFPKDHSIIGTRWVFRNKLDKNGNVVRNKARLVAQGYNQQEGIDYDETFVPVARPDIVFAVGLCARFQTSPKESHLIAVKRIFRYLVGTPDVGLWYKKGSHFDLQAYCDADYVGDKIERKSTSGACQFLGEALVSWCCRKQNTIALSTTEAEYVVASNCCSQVIWIKNQLEDFSLRSSSMARTKNAGGRMVPRTKNPSVSSSPPRSPSPPKPPTPKSSSSSSYEIASESHKSNPTNEEDSPSPTATIPSPKDSPPVLVKIKKSKSFDSSKIRRSSRIMSGAGKKPVVDTTVHVLDQSDSEIDLLEKEIDEFELEHVTSTKSEPDKPKKTPTPKKKEVETAVKAPRAKKKINVKKSKEKLLPAPLIQPEDEEIFDNFFHIKEIVYPLLVQAFYFNAKVFPEKDLITSNIKDVELVVDPYVIGSLIGIKSEGLEVYGNDWCDQVKINKEDHKKKMFTEEGAKKNAPPSSMLKTEYKLLHNMCQHSFFPRTGSKDKVTDLDLLMMYHMAKGVTLNLPYIILHHMIHAATSGFKKIALPYAMLLTRVFRLYYADMNDTPFKNHYYTFNLKNVSHMKKEVESPVADVEVKRKREVFEKSNLNVLADASGDHLENVLQTDGNTQISGDANPTTESEKLATTAATTLQVNAANAGTQQLMFEGNGMAVQHSMMDHLILESKTLRTWFTSVVCPQLHLPPPPEIEIPHFDLFPAQNEKSDDDENHTTSPAPDGVNE
ncbi:hypothetical protein TSUD_188830 [Trifolium subterraneum]|uniref:Uncharacterized protein n=1 Tax=Trifolium subterraneum TaxID=3900 RepID=A0A2Z6PEI5_TRISU|nr:hypothetical protein TSUD_188830 [Trifolium subterraneum]